MKLARVRIALVTALTLSLCGNAYLFATRPRVPEHEQDGSAAILEGGTKAASTMAAIPPPRLPTQGEMSNVDRTTLEQRLVAAEAKLEQLLPESERWARGIRRPQDEERARPVLDKFFDVKPSATATRPYDLECRDQICKLSVEANAARSRDWLEWIQTDPEALGLFESRSFTGDTAFVLLRDRRSGASISLMARIVGAFESSPEIDACKKQHVAPGTMTLTVSLDDVARRLRTTATGPLADQPAGFCILKAAEALFSTIAISSEVTSFPELPIPVKIPTAP